MIYRLENGNECASLTLCAGDAVLFRSGSVTRGWIDTVPGVTYGAWGDGDSPVISGTDDVSSASDWEEVGDCVWKCVKTIRADVGNLIFNGGDCSASLRWCRSDLCRDGDFFDESFGRGFGDRGADSLYLFCDGNPAKKYSRIETVPFGHRKLAHVRDGATFEGLTFYGGLHGIQGVGGDLTVRECRFKAIGGNVWNFDRRIRFGNGVEIWDRGDDVTVENCEFKDIYDSCVTYQGSGKCLPARRFVCRGNRFDTYGMAAFEYRDRMPIDSVFENNLCENAGCGFAMLGEELPRQSEIWPEPMGHHLFFWRMPEPTPDGSLLVKDNVFGDAPNGAAVYSIICRAAEEQITFTGNHYVGKTLTNKFGGELA